MTRFAYSGVHEPYEDIVRDHLLQASHTRVSIDIETVSLKDTRMIGFGVATSPAEAFYFPYPLTIPDGDAELIFQVLELLGDPTVTKVAHNIAYDMHRLWEMGVDDTNIIDTRTACWHCGVPAELGEAAYALLEWEIKSIKDILPPRQTMLSLPLEVVAAKCMDDCRATLGIHDRMIPYLTKHFDQDMELLPTLLRMGRRGVKIDHDARLQLLSRYQADVEYYQGLCSAEGFNPGSPQQVAYILMQRGNFLPIVRGKVTTDEEALYLLEDPLAQVVLNYRKAKKVVGTYLEPWGLVDRAMTKYHLCTATGRLASVERNMQNIPVELRSCLVSDSGSFTDWDYSQQEYRCLAYLSGDPLLNKWYSEGRDVHQMTADVMGIQRKTAKNTGYAMIYGGDDATVQATAGIRDARLVSKLRNTWLELFPVAGVYIAKAAEEGLQDGYVTTLGGRKLYLPKVEEVGPDEVKRKAVNYRIQGSCAEYTKEALRRQASHDIAVTVHDSTLVDEQLSESYLKEELDLEHLSPFYCPIEVKHTERWG